MKVVTIASQKGGVGKTSSAVTIAHGLALAGRETLIIDLDPQGQVASHLGRQHESGVFSWLIAEEPVSDVIRSSGRDGLSLIPSDKRTATAASVLMAEGRLTPAILADALGNIPPRYDYVLFDCAPTVGGLQEAAIYAADLVIIPAALDYLSAEGAASTLGTLQSIQGKGGRGRLLGLLPTFLDTTRESRATLEDLVERLGAAAVLDPIHRAVALREAAAAGLTIFEHDATSRAAQEYARLVQRILEA